MKRCAYYHSPIGIIRIEERDGFLVSMTFVDDFAEGVSSSSPILAITTRWLDRYFSGEKLKKLPRYRLVGTEFQKQVWEALLSIPYGSTASYMDIARMIDPDASGIMCRAAGNAVGANPLAILIPCHRVIRTDGKIGQYRWGAEKKQWLLGHEASTGRRRSMRPRTTRGTYTSIRTLRTATTTTAATDNLYGPCLNNNPHPTCDTATKNVAL